MNSDHLTDNEKQLPYYIEVYNKYIENILIEVIATTNQSKMTLQEEPTNKAVVKIKLFTEFGVVEGEETININNLENSRLLAFTGEKQKVYDLTAFSI